MHEKPYQPSRNWAASLMFLTTTLVALIAVPLVGILHGYSLAAWAWAGVLFVVTEMSITCGYHRLFAHATYKAHPCLKALFLFFGAMALQNSALNWSAGHRAHHRFLDDPARDPYCARRGFWFSHIGWMLRDYPSGEPDLKFVRDLERDPVVAFEHRYYFALAIGLNIGLPLMLGMLYGDLLGMLLIAGVTRLVLTHQLTFCINSLAHMVGRRPYTITNTARDSGLIAFLTFGEGYHNYHHRFAEDYRNGVHWWHWDPSKWLIATLYGFGLVTHVKRAPQFSIRRAMLETQLQLAEQTLQQIKAGVRWGGLHRQLQAERKDYQRVVASFSALRERPAFPCQSLQKWDAVLSSRAVKVLEHKLAAQYRRVRLLGQILRDSVAAEATMAHT